MTMHQAQTAAPEAATPLNPPAFPSEQHETQDGSWNQTYCDGMSLRDWFAGQSIGGIVDVDSRTPAYAAEWAYLIADAMLEAREARASNSPGDLLAALRICAVAIQHALGPRMDMWLDPEHTMKLSDLHALIAKAEARS